MPIMKILTVICNSSEEVKKVLENGSDEVILPVEGGCFTSMPCFSIQQIEEIAKNNPKRTVVLMNRLFPEGEKEKAKEMLSQLVKVVDAVMFADIGFMKLAQEKNFVGKMIYRPETLMTSVNDISFWSSLGLQSVQISPLLTEEEILTIASKVPHTGLQIHGRMLMSVSKRKLLSAYQQLTNCQNLHEEKDLYLQEMKRDGKMPIYENEYGTYIYSDFIQESFSYMPKLMEAGIERFEIDGNGLEMNALLDAVKLYRDCLDGKEIHPETYFETYHLPFSTGYYGQKTVK